MTTTQATNLVNNGSMMCRCLDDVYRFHQFTGDLDGDSYLIQTPKQTDLGLDVNSTEAQCKTALITYFKTQEYKGVAPVISDMKVF